MRAAVLFVCVSLYVNADSASAPFITACADKDDACHKTSAQNAVTSIAAGVPALGIKSMDPMHVDLIEASQAGLHMVFKNTVVKGLRNCNVLSLKRQGVNSRLELQCSVVLVGDYELSGKLLILPVEGNGRYKIKIRDLIEKISFMVGEKEKDGDKYWYVKSYKQTSDVKTNAEFHFQNLFNGNKQLSDAIHEFANTNWREIMKEVAPPIIDAVIKEVVDQVSKLFDNVPVKELALS